VSWVKHYFIWGLEVGVVNICTKFWSIAFILSTKIAKSSEAQSVSLTYYKKKNLGLMLELMD